MKNFWTRGKVVAKGYDFWTFEIYDTNQKTMVPETMVAIDERPSMKIVEKLEVEENGKKIWTPVLMVWEKFEATYTDENFLKSHNNIRLLETDGDTVGILRLYDKSGEHIQSWVMHGLKIEDMEFPGEYLKATFTFHHVFAF